MLTREQHMDMANCLKLAKKKLRGGSNQLDEFTSFVCTAVNYTWVSKDTKKLVTDWIDSQLKGFSFATSWAQHNGVDVSSYEKCQAYRHAWVDHMIKVLES